MKPLLKILLIVLFSVVTLFTIGRYGWRLLGFSVCDDPTVIYVESVTVDGDSACIHGGTVDSFSAYVGYIYQISDGKLYLGVKHNAFLGFIRRLGAFSVTVPTDGQAFSEIYLKNSGEERLIWTRADGAVQLPASPHAPTTQATPVAAFYPFDQMDGANDLCAVLFLGYDETSGDQSVTFSPFISLENGNIAEIDGAYTRMYDQ